jgi:DNA-binding beta-propeller fold protein YncE
MAYPGYNFTGWNTAADGSGTNYSDGASFPFSANTTLYAQWLANTSTAYVPASNTVTKINLSTFTVVGSLAVGEAYSIAIDNTSTYAYVPSFWYNTITKINLSTFTVVGSLIWPWPLTIRPPTPT